MVGLESAEDFLYICFLDFILLDHCFELIERLGEPCTHWRPKLFQFSTTNWLVSHPEKFDFRLPLLEVLVLTWCQVLSQFLRCRAGRTVPHVSQICRFLALDWTPDFHCQSPVSGKYVGTLVGDFQTQVHNVQGRVYAVNDRTLYIVGLTYDGEGPAMAAALQKIDIDPEQQIYTPKIVDIAAAVMEMHGYI
ncbi:hypothetical protein LAZ67_1002666 [Cordylochernes scorpioides]|uniref:DM13 domain-containing protein n=1 Tax=Cordylochernes scorpioides TaxID=51811 RepID=A0ABY6JZ10_9ARAC|nr:hypothetical protein LAZ67_1002666 [Cordylochernes scorpioides]